MGAGSGGGETGASGSRPNKRLTRRDFLRAGAMAGVAGAVGAKFGSGLRPAQGRLIEAAMAIRVPMAPRKAFTSFITVFDPSAAPAIKSEWPPMYFVREYSEMSAPCSIGR